MCDMDTAPAIDSGNTGSSPPCNSSASSGYGRARCFCSAGSDYLISTEPVADMRHHFVTAWWCDATCNFPGWQAAGSNRKCVVANVYAELLTQHMAKLHLSQSLQCSRRLGRQTSGGATTMAVHLYPLYICTRCTSVPAVHLYPLYICTRCTSVPAHLEGVGTRAQTPQEAGSLAERAGALVCWGVRGP
jgi:hypothetical protein